MPAVVAALFFLIAALYASVGFAGGSSYLAILAWLDLPTDQVRSTALGCNLVVSLWGLGQAIRRATMPWRFLLPLVGCSMPAAWFAASMTISRPIFLGLVSGCLGISAVALLLPQKKEGDSIALERRPSRAMSLVACVVGLPLGLVAGWTGIGGGIYLAPVLHLMRWGTPVQIASLATGLIACNSIAGLLGRWSVSGGWQERLDPSFTMWTMAALGGGMIGNRWLHRHRHGPAIRSITGIVVALVAMQLAFRAASMIP
jgi:uncharacterized membrane protein YfcA